MLRYRDIGKFAICTDDNSGGRLVETNEEKIATKGITGTEGNENIKTLRKVVAGAGFEPTTFGL